MPKLALVCAMSLNRVIGRHNQLPWHLPADLQFFKRTTLGKPVIMGRKTYESIGRPLPGRTNIVVSRQANFRADGVHVADSLSRAMEIARHHSTPGGEYCVIGGADLYAQALPFAERFYLTEVQAQLDGDAFFPDCGLGAWRLVSEHFQPADALNRFDMVFKVLEPSVNL